MEGTFQHFLLGIFAVANNFPALGPFLALCATLNRQEQIKIAGVATLSSFIVMTLSMLVGMAILDFFGIGISAFQIAGGLLLCASGTGMLNAKDASGVHDKQAGAISNSQIISSTIVPISIPLTTGAGTMSTVTLFADLASQNHVSLILFAAICAMTVIIFASFYFAAFLVKALGEIGMSVFIKVMGLFTLAIGVQFIITGVTRIYSTLPH